MLWILIIAATGVALLGCASLPRGRTQLRDIEFSGNRKLGSDELKSKMASSESRRFLGLFTGVIYDYSVFDRYVLERDLQRIERYYRARGYYLASVRAGRVFREGTKTRVEIIVEEGPAVRLVRVDVHGLDSLPPSLQEKVRGAAARVSGRGRVFEEKRFSQGADRIARVLSNNGYAYVQVQKAAEVDLLRNRASAGYWVKPGKPARFGEVSIAGLGSLPENRVRRALDLRPGRPYSTRKLEAAKRSLLDLGVFSSVTVAPQLDQKEQPAVVPIRVTVEPSKLRTVQLGAGAQIDTLKTDLHGTAGWEDRNFFGGLRRFQAQVKPGVVLYPTRLPDFQAPRHVLPQGRGRIEFRQPGLFEARTDGLASIDAQAAPLILTTQTEEGVPVLGYGDTRFGVGAERSFWRLHTILTQNVQVSVPFSYLGKLDPDLGPVVISYPNALAVLDLRDQTLEPHRGAYLSGDLQVAGLGGDARDVRTRVEARGYIPVARRTTVALRATAGLLFPFNYGNTIRRNALTHGPGNADRAAWVRDLQITFLRGFFSGGAGSNRGYAYREVGPHGVAPFYNPGQTAASITDSCDPANPEFSLARCDVPLGGFTLWEGSVELRFPIRGPLSAVVFVDASDVSAARMDFRFNRPHLSVGPGVRYRTPVGPVRVDIGYRVPGLQAPPAADESDPRTIMGLPIAITLGIGES